MAQMVSIAFYVSYAGIIDVAVPNFVRDQNNPTYLQRLTGDVNTGYRIINGDELTSTAQPFTINEPGIYGLLVPAPVSYVVPIGVFVIGKAGKDPWPRPPPPPPPRIMNPAPELLSTLGIPDYYLWGGAFSDPKYHGITFDGFPQPRAKAAAPRRSKGK